MRGQNMIDFLKNKSIKAYQEIMDVVENPNLLFSNDPKQVNAEANYNVYTIERINKVIKKNQISINELARVFNAIEMSWELYLKKHYSGKSFFFYMWGDVWIPAIKVSVISHFEGLLPFGCPLNRVNEMNPMLQEFMENAQFDGLKIVEENKQEGLSEQDYCLTVYSKIISC